MDPTTLSARLTAWLVESDIEHEVVDEGQFVVVLPGRAKLRTTVSLSIGRDTLVINAFVCRRPDENAEAVYRWILRRNTRLLGIAFALDHLGDIYLVGRLPLADLTEEDFDRLLGSVLATSDESFNVLLKLGFASAIRRERAWRVSRGESLANLAAFDDVR